MLLLGLADFNATREMGPILALGIAVMVVVRAHVDARAAVGVRAAGVLARDQGRAEATRAPASGRGGALVRRHPRRGVRLAAAAYAGALGNLGGRDDLDFTSITGTRPTPSRASAGAPALFPPGTVARSTSWSSSPAGSSPRDELRRSTRASPTRTPRRIQAGARVSSRSSSRVDPFGAARWTWCRGCARSRGRPGRARTGVIGGVAAETYEAGAAVRRDAKVIVPLALVLILLVLVVLLRSSSRRSTWSGPRSCPSSSPSALSSLIFTHLRGQPGSDPNLTIFASSSWSGSGRRQHLPDAADPGERRGGMRRGRPCWPVWRGPAASSRGPG